MRWCLAARGEERKGGRDAADRPRPPRPLQVPCSASGLLTAERAGQLQCEAIVGATNLPFASEEAQAVAERELGITFVPEGAARDTRPLGPQSRSEPACDV